MFLLAAQTPPPDNSVVAGPIGFTVFILLIVGVAFLCWNFTKQLKKVEKAKAEGVFGDDAAEQAQGEAKAEDAEAEPHDTDA